MTQEPVTFVIWKWDQPGCRSSYNAKHVNVWCSMLERRYTGPKRVILVSDDMTGVNGGCEKYPLWKDFNDVRNPSGGRHLPSCYRRLKIFNAATTTAMGIPHEAKVVSMDLDVVMVDDITPLFAIKTYDFVGWRRIGPKHPPGYNGSIFMFRAGTMDKIWSTFDPKTSPMIANRLKYYGSDQGWISYCLRGTMPGWSRIDGIYSFSSDVHQKPYPQNARLISFNGKHKPWSDEVRGRYPWIEKNWR